MEEKNPADTESLSLLINISWYCNRTMQFAQLRKWMKAEMPLKDKPWHS